MSLSDRYEWKEVKRAEPIEVLNSGVAVSIDGSMLYTSLQLAKMKRRA